LTQAYSTSGNEMPPISDLEVLAEISWSLLRSIFTLEVDASSLTHGNSTVFDKVVITIIFEM
jgi:hypothetical protein